ncbi:helix-turn-helix domain-containing protein [Megasphaera sp.]|uniref:helix-turn-helix domain-containing protein n=1 Tax=Megasphaera sp. TaxID=2023260 RepID=UPI003521BBF9
MDKEKKNKESIGTRFRIIRKTKQMNQCEFAKALDISQAYLSSIETGRRTPKLEVVQKLADMGFPMKWIIEGTDAASEAKEMELSRAQRRRDIEFITEATDEMDDREVHFVREWVSLYLAFKDDKNRSDADNKENDI